MRTFYHFIIIIFVIASLFVVKDDAIIAYKKIKSFAVESFYEISDIYKNFLDKNNIEYKKRGLLDSIYREKVITDPSLPGPLKVSYGLLDKNGASSISLDRDAVVLSTNNQRRKETGLEDLIVNSKLNLSANKKLEDMFANNYFEHLSPEGIGVSDLGKIFEYDYILIGENLAMGNFNNEDALLEAWMSSEGHKANILNTKYKEIGVAVGKGLYKGKEVWMAVQHFGVPKEVCTSVSEYLHGLINIKQQEISKTESDLIYRKANIDSGIISNNGKTRSEQIGEYNEIINNYNEMVLDLKQKINDYNIQADKFNTCVQGYIN
jgi:hypothetical protein